MPNASYPLLYAAVEGWADFVAAWAFNRNTENDCLIDFQNTSDYDLDGFSDAVNNVVDCEDVVIQTSGQLADTHDYIVDLVNANDDWNNDGIQCHGATTNRGTEFDWMRFWWDMLTDEAVPLGELADIYDDMDPRSWDITQATGAISDDPVVRLMNAASGNGYSTAYTNQDHNGVAH